MLVPPHEPADKVASQSMQSDLGLNIREAHAFNTMDKFSLDVFVVDQVHCPVRQGVTDRPGTAQWGSQREVWTALVHSGRQVASC